MKKYAAVGRGVRRMMPALSEALTAPVPARRSLLDRDRFTATGSTYRAPPVAALSTDLHIPIAAASVAIVNLHV